MLLVIFYYYYPSKAWGTLTETEFPLAVMPVSKKVWCKYSKHTEGRSEEGLYHHSHQGTEAQITSHTCRTHTCQSSKVLNHPITVYAELIEGV